MRLRELRRESGMTMKQLGCKFNLAESTISAYENGNREPDITTLIKLADFFGVSMDYLLERTISEKKLTAQDIVKNPTYRSEVIKLADICQNLNNLGVGMVIGYATRLAETSEYRIDE